MKLCKVLTAALALTCLGTVAQAQDQTLSASNATGSGSVDVTISMDSAAGNIQGWSWGVENDSAVAMVSGVVDGSTTATVGSGGMPPAFNQVNLFSNGWTVGVVIDFLGCCTLAPGAGYEMNVASYDVVGAPGDTTSVCFVETLGSPPTATVVVIGGASVPPATVCGSIEVAAGPAQFQYSTPDQTVTFSGPTVDFSAEMTVTEDMSFGPSNTQGFSMDLAHDGGLLTVNAISAINDLAGLNGGTGPSFFGQNLLAGGWTLGVVYNFLGGVFLQFQPGAAIVQADYTANGPTDGQTTMLNWVDTLGSPPVVNVVVVGGASIGAEGVDATITFAELIDPTFIRGDCNDDLIVDIADGIWILNNLFQGGPSGPCAEACDSNDDGSYDSSDATYIFNYRFLGGPPPPAPFPACGTGGADLTCASSCP